MDRSVTAAGGADGGELHRFDGRPTALSRRQPAINIVVTAICDCKYRFTVRYRTK
jgi:hypothetical protein